MPIYTFRCPSCGYKFTSLFSMDKSEGKNVVCPKCRKRGLKRVYEGSFSLGKKSNPSCPTGACPLSGK